MSKSGHQPSLNQVHHPYQDQSASKVSIGSKENVRQSKLNEAIADPLFDDESKSKTLQDSKLKSGQTSLQSAYKKELLHEMVISEKGKSERNQNLEFQIQREIVSHQKSKLLNKAMEKSNIIISNSNSHPFLQSTRINLPKDIGMGMSKRILKEENKPVIPDISPNNKSLNSDLAQSLQQKKEQPNIHFAPINQMKIDDQQKQKDFKNESNLEKQPSLNQENRSQNSISSPNTIQIPNGNVNIIKKTPYEPIIQKKLTTGCYPVINRNPLISPGSVIFKNIVYTNPIQTIIPSVNRITTTQVLSVKSSTLPHKIPSNNINAKNPTSLLEARFFDFEERRKQFYEKIARLESDTPQNHLTIQHDQLSKKETGRDSKNDEHVSVLDGESGEIEEMHLEKVEKQIQIHQYQQELISSPSRAQK